MDEPREGDGGGDAYDLRALRDILGQIRGAVRVALPIDEESQQLVDDLISKSRAACGAMLHPVSIADIDDRPATALDELVTADFLVPEVRE